MKALALISAAGIAIVLQGGGPPIDAAPDDASVRAVALKSYIHGITDSLADEEVGPEGVPALLALLRDPEFPRRDNVVAFLAHLPGDAAVPVLIEMLERPWGDLRRPAEDRAMLLAPHALGLIAARGNDEALAALMAMTEPGAGVLGRATNQGRYDRRMRDELVRRAVHALGSSGRKEALARLTNLATRTHPIVEGLDVRSEARESIADRAEASAPESPPSPATPDPSLRAHETMITFAQHVDLTSASGLAYDDAEVDRILLDADALAAVPNFPEDVACCHRLGRASSGLVFGAPGDGRDVVDGRAELEQIAQSPVARVKVVREINWCGGSATNVLGCSFRGGNGMVIVKLGNGFDGALWLHEYGHNAGLGHDQDARYVMYPELIGLTGYNAALRDSQCAALHAPPAETAATIVDVGACTDDDGDSVVVTGDNCPLLSNPDQYDADRDHRGSACDNCPYVPNYGQSDFDGDTWGDVCDRCPGVYDDQSDGDADGIGDACDSCPLSAINDYDLDGSCGDVDNCPWTWNPAGENADGDTSGDACDPCPLDPYDSDPDQDAICTPDDPCPFDWSPTAPDWSLAFGTPVVAIGAGDVDADGFDDLLIAFPQTALPGPPVPVPGAGELWLYRGSPSGLPAKPSSVRLGTAASLGLGRNMAPAGDVDADGHADVLINSIEPSMGPPRRVVSLYRGVSGGIASEPSWSVSSAESESRFGDTLAGGSDINGDGYLDVVIGDSWTERVYVYFGGAEGLSKSAALVLRPTGAVPGRFGYSVAVVGDLDGDGWQDIAVGSPYRSILFDGNEGRVQVYFGPFLDSSPSPQWTIDGADHQEYLGFSLARVGDVDGDGLDDLAVGAPGHSPNPSSSGPGAVVIQPGDRARELRPARHLLPRGVGTFLRYGSFGVSLASLGDVQGDGYDDIAVGGGRPHLFSGSSTGLGWGASWTAALGQSTVGRAGDVNGDGYADLLLVTILDIEVFLGGPQGFAANRPRDLDHDGTPDACDADSDGDGVPNSVDRCPFVPEPGQLDSDQDYRGDACDNCPLLADYSQDDPDQDGIGSPCDACPYVSDPEQADFDGDGIGDACDPDVDGDDSHNLTDNCLWIPNADQADIDADGIGDACDDCTDVDGDGLSANPSEACTATLGVDCDDNDPSSYPGAFDACDGKDNDCNSFVDDAICSDFTPAGRDRVDGYALAWIGRVFGQCTTDASSVPWSSIDFTHDKCIDGSDLSVLGVVWGCSGDMPICR